MKEFRVIELFAGVGGFRIGLNRANADFFKIIWSNQWEPATKIQHASRIYVKRFGDDNHSNDDISNVSSTSIPVHDMLCGGFPCQDYSVARTLSQSKGIDGKKGVLWWQIYRIIEEKGADKPSVLFLENVDRLLLSPASQRGRDFSIILQCLSDLGYYAEWRVINAAEYGMPQKRRRIYILAYKIGSKIASEISSASNWLFYDGIFAKAFPIKAPGFLIPYEGFSIKGAEDRDLADITVNFNKKNNIRPYSTGGVMMNGTVFTYPVIPDYEGPITTIGDIIVKGEDRKYLTEDFFILDDVLPRWEYLKGSKRETKINKDGHEFVYSEGAMIFPDRLDKPSRTIITSEGGKGPSRFTHVIRDPETGRLRRLLPIELERLDMFPDNHTEGESDKKRAFFMGNALVCGIITSVGNEIYERLKGE